MLVRNVGKWVLVTLVPLGTAVIAASSKIVESNWALAIGAALGATGVILELTAPSSTPSTRIGIGPTGIVVSRGW